MEKLMKLKLLITILVTCVLTACSNEVPGTSSTTALVTAPATTTEPTPHPVKLPDSKVWRQLEKLEEKALIYTKQDIKEASKMVVRFVRTGHANYQTDIWQLLAGEEDKKFTCKLPASTYSLQKIEYIQDTASKEKIDFPHLCASLNLFIPYHDMSTEMCDIGSWVGDSIELMEQLKQSGYSKAEYNKQASRLLGKRDSRFSTMDLLADIDANNIRSSMDITQDTIVEAMKKYYENLPQQNRYERFIKTRFPKVQNKKALRQAIWNCLGGEPGILTTKLYAEHGISPKDKKLIRAVSNAFADKLWKKAQGKI